MGKHTLQTGLDVGNSHIKLVQVSGKPGSAPTLSNFDVITIEQGEEGLNKALKDIAKTLPNKEVSISVSGPAAIVRYIELPKMNEEELKSSMKYEAEKYIPFNLKDVIIDCQVLETLPRGKVKVLLTAAKKDVVNERIKSIEGAGLSVKLIDCDSFALINAFLLNFPPSEDMSSTALVDIGEKLTTINIIKGAAPQLTRELELGGSDFAKAISAKMGVGINEASGLKEDPDSRIEELMGAVRPTIVRIIEEIKLSLTYYENQTGMAVDRIFLSGGLSAFKGLVEMFKETMGMECSLWDPVKGLLIDKGVDREKLDKIKNRLHVAVGLAIRE
jgi:type IV pilus assembly protein PilM